MEKERANEEGTEGEDGGMERREVRRKLKTKAIPFSSFSCISCVQSIDHLAQISAGRGFILWSAAGTQTLCTCIH